MLERTVIGCIGTPDDGGHHTCRKFWNAIFSQQNISATFEIYPLTLAKDVQLRLAEMELHARRAYILHGTELQRLILPFLDRIDAHAQQEQRVDTVLNNSGVLVGYALETNDDRYAVTPRFAHWFPRK